MFSLKIGSFGRVIIPALFALNTVSASAGGGITLGSTRILYPENSKQMSVSVSNTSDDSSFLVQSWVENEKGAKTKDFIITPPLFKSGPKNDNLLRVMYVGQPLPKDKESLFYFNTKAIPALDKNDDGGSALILATVTRIKMFVRPEGLPMLPEKAKEALEFKKADGGVTISNPSPYYLTLTDIKVGDKSVDGVMVPPKDSAFLKVPTGVSGTLIFSTINDYGGITKPQVVDLK